MIISTKWRKRFFIHNTSLTGHKKCMLSMALGLLKTGAVVLFGIGDSRFFPRIDVTIFSKRFVKLITNDVL